MNEDPNGDSRSSEDFCCVRSICWFSCGAASAVATKLALQERDNCEIVYQDTGAEFSHPRNED
jgi:3'-phosphoadenosine 5'-phosphosulfate sulfotransferase (PAPS reductase)/FAD synthetase